MTDKPHVETMAETWQRLKPTAYFRTHYDGKQDYGMTEFVVRLKKIDPDGKLKLVDGGVTIFFSDGSSYRMP